MKTILVPTDFSRGATHAAESASWLAEQLRTQLLLWNCAPRVPVMPGYLGGPTFAEAVAGTVESRDRFGELTEELADFMTNSGGEYRPQLATRYSEGSFRDGLTQLLHEDTFELIVIGAPSGCAVEHIFTGSHTLQVIEAANCPVLIVPSRAALNQLEKVVFATDHEPGDLAAIGYLSELSRLLKFAIEVVHIVLNGTDSYEPEQKETSFKEQLAKLKNARITCKELRGKEVVGRLNRVGKQTGADLLAMSHHHYSFFKKLFSQSKVERELAHQKIPLLVFPLNDQTV